MPLKDMLDAAARGGTVEVEAGWTQGRAIYGGLTGALLLSAVKGRLREHHAGADDAAAYPLRSLTVSFVAPATPGPVEITAEVLRSGSNVTQCQSTLRQGGAVVATALAAFGRHRESDIAVDAAHVMPDLGDPDDLEPFPFMEGLTPDFYRFVDLRQVSGALPFSGADSGDLAGWTALREPPAEFSEEHLVVIADAWPPAVLQMLSAAAPASSLTWTLELISEIGPESAAGGGRFAYEATTDSARDGYAHTHAMLWRPDGALVAVSRQTITVFG